MPRIQMTLGLLAAVAAGCSQQGASPLPSSTASSSSTAPPQTAQTQTQAPPQRQTAVAGAAPAASGPAAASAAPDPAAKPATSTPAGGAPSGAAGVAAVAGGRDAAVGGAPSQQASGAAGAAAGSASSAPVDQVGSSGCTSDAPLEPGETTTTLQVGGTTRELILHIPTGYTGKTAVPLVVDWHALLTDSDFERGNSGYRQLSDKEGFVVAWPNGTDRAWNVGPCCTFDRGVDDLGFARALVADIQARACIDNKRVYSAGYSMGGGMSHFLACNAGDLFAAVAPSAFDLFIEEEEPCKPSRPISVLAFRGTADPVVPYAGGESMPPNGLQVTIHFRGAEANFADWARMNQCTGSPEMTSEGCQTYKNCAAGTETTLCTSVGGGHVTGDAVMGWEMFKRHTLP